MTKNKQLEFKNYKLTFVTTYIVFNMVVIFGLLIVTEREATRCYYILYICYVYAGTMVVISIGSILYEIKYFIERLLFKKMK